MVNNRMHIPSSAAETSAEHPHVEPFTVICASILCSIALIQICEVLQKAQAVQARGEKQAGKSPSLRILLYSASIYRSLLKHLMFMENV